MSNGAGVEAERAARLERVSARLRVFILACGGLAVALAVLAFLLEEPAVAWGAVGLMGTSVVLVLVRIGVEAARTGPFLAG